MSELVDFDPWLKTRHEGDAVPPEAKLVCRHTVDTIEFRFEEAIYLHAGDGWFDFWINVSDDECDEWLTAKAGRIRDPGDERDEARFLLDALFRSRIGYMAGCGVVEPGLVSSDEYDAIKTSISREIEANNKMAREIEASIKLRAEVEGKVQGGEGQRVSTIVDLARKLGLDPRPAGTGPYNWVATCPETSHRLMLSTLSDQFGCGWCRERGGAGELTGLVLMRRNKFA